MSMIPVNRKFLRGDIYYANLEPHLGSEQGGIRPVVVVQNNTANCYSPNLIVAFLSNFWGSYQRGREGFLLFDYWITMVRLISLLE